MKPTDICRKCRRSRSSHTVDGLSCAGYVWCPATPELTRPWQVPQTEFDPAPTEDQAEMKPEFSGNKYHRKIFGLKAHGQQGTSVTIDVYSVLNAYRVTIPGCQHAAKKILCGGLRNKASQLQDLREARDALDRAIEDAEREANLAGGA